MLCTRTNKTRIKHKHNLIHTHANGETKDLPDLVARRERMPGVERWQTTYVRYKTQPEAAAVGPSAGWQLAESRRFAEQLAAEEGGFPEDGLLYSGAAPLRVALRIVEAPAEYAVPVKQDRCGSFSFAFARRTVCCLEAAGYQKTPCRGRLRPHTPHQHRTKNPKTKKQTAASRPTFACAPRCGSATAAASRLR